MLHKLSVTQRKNYLFDDYSDGVDVSISGDGGYLDNCTFSVKNPEGEILLEQIARLCMSASRHEQTQAVFNLSMKELNNSAKRTEVAKPKVAAE